MTDVVLTFQAWMNQAVSDLQLVILPITIECADIQSRLEYHHRDSFDRLLVAHAQIDATPIPSVDDIFDRYMGSTDLVI